MRIFGRDAGAYGGRETISEARNDAGEIAYNFNGGESGEDGDQGSRVFKNFRKAVGHADKRVGSRPFYAWETGAV